MKKTNFLSSLGAKLALAAVVLTSTMFTSCSKEDFSATFKPSPAEVTINVQVIDALSQLDKTSEATINVPNFNEVESGKFTAPYPTGVPAQTTVAITATLGENGIANYELPINATKAGGKATYNVKLVVADGLVIETVAGESVSETIYAGEFNHEYVGHDAVYTHEGTTGWFTNATDYYLPFSFDYDVIKNKYSEVSDVTYAEWAGTNLDDAQKTAIKVAHDAIKNATAEVEKATLKGKISAWSYFNMYATYTTTDYTCTAKTINSEDVAATFTYKGHNSTEAAYTEIAHPEYSHKYIHGHGHGGASNAGGGIVLPE